MNHKLFAVTGPIKIRRQLINARQRQLGEILRSETRNNIKARRISLGLEGVLGGSLISNAQIIYSYRAFSRD